MQSTDGWRGKANRMIADYCLQSYRAANVMPNGRKRANHVPYTVPAIAEALIAALAADDEHEVKRLFVVESTASWSLI